MTASKAVVAGRFHKGDARINKHGRKSKAAVELSTEMSRALADEGLKKKRFQLLAEMCWTRALRGETFFVDLIWERVVGKVTQPIGGEDGEPIKGQLTVKVVMVRADDPGNGNGNGNGKGHEAK